MTFEEAKRSFSVGAWEAIERKLWLAAGGEQAGAEGLAAIGRDEQTIMLVDATKKLVDASGRTIPLTGMKGVQNGNTAYRIVQSQISYAGIHANLTQLFGGLTFVSVEEFASRAEAIIARIKGDRQIANLLKGPYLPICLPQFAVSDYGRDLEQTFLVATARSYERSFLDRKFHNCRAGELAGQVSVVEASRHQQVIDAMGQKPLVAVYFADPLRGFSIPADREMIKSFGQDVSLTGAIDTAVAIAADPQMFARDNNTPVLDCAANTWRSEGSLFWYARGGKLYFDCRNLSADAYASGGLLFVG